MPITRRLCLTRLPLRLLWLATLLLAVAGCSNAPSDSAVQQAVQARIQQDLGKAENAARTLGGDSAVKLLHSLGTPEPSQVTVANIDILDSQSQDDGSYRMRVRFDTRTPDASHTSEQTYALEKTDNGWRAIPSD